MNKKVIELEGMHCESCKIVVKDKIQKYSNSNNIKIDLTNNSATLYFKDNLNLDTDKINAELKELGYTIKDIKNTKNDKLLAKKSGAILINKRHITDVLKLLIAIGLSITMFFLLEQNQTLNIIDMNKLSDRTVYFMVSGLVASVSTCSTLTGTILLTLTKHWSNNNDSFKSHLSFHTGRFVGFFILGGLLGLIGSSISLNGNIFASTVIIIVAIISIVLGLQMLDISLLKSIPLPEIPFISRFVLSEKRNLIGVFITGFGTFLIPCGYTLNAQLQAITTNSFWESAYFMLIFAIGTAPVLLLISYSGKLLNTKSKFNKAISYIFAIFMITASITTVNSHLNLLNIPSLSDLMPSLSNDDTTSIYKEGGVQGVKITAIGDKYIATSSTTIKSSVDTVIIIDNKGIEGCGVFMAAEGLFDGTVRLASGINRVNIGKPKTGKYKITCSMGMVTPIVLRVI